MSEPEKKGSTWPWILVPIGTVILFFVLRECQHRLPPADHAAAPAVTLPVAPDAPAPAAPNAEAAAAPASAPAPQ
jgi:hypothetical protein